MSRCPNFRLAVGAVIIVVPWLTGVTASASPLAAASRPPSVLEAPQLVSYRANYDLTLVRADPGGSVVAGDGALRIVFENVCQGYTLTQQLHTRTAGEDGNVVDSDFTSTSFESIDGRRLQFNIHDRVNGILVESYNGVAHIPELGGTGRATFNEPKRTPLGLPAGTVFPTMQLRRLLWAAAAGKDFVSVPIFDGSGKSGLSQTGSFIGKRSPAAGAGFPAGLRGVASWPVRMAYFTVGTKTMRPDYEIGFRLFANGVSTNLVLDFGSFTFDGTLAHFSILPPFPCHHR